MGAEDTIINECVCEYYGRVPFKSAFSEVIHHCYECDAYNSGKLAQAEISFKAGYMEGYPDGFKDGGKVGMKKVVDWIERTKKIRVPKYQLKEWGLDEPSA